MRQRRLVIQQVRGLLRRRCTTHVRGFGFKARPTLAQAKPQGSQACTAAVDAEPFKASSGRKRQCSVTMPADPHQHREATGNTLPPAKSRRVLVLPKFSKVTRAAPQPQQQSRALQSAAAAKETCSPGRESIGARPCRAQALPAGAAETAPATLADPAINLPPAAHTPPPASSSRPATGNHHSILNNCTSTSPARQLLLSRQQQPKLSSPAMVFTKPPNGAPAPMHPGGKPQGSSAPAGPAAACPPLRPEVSVMPPQPTCLKGSHAAQQATAIKSVSPGLPRTAVASEPRAEGLAGAVAAAEEEPSQRDHTSAGQVSTAASAAAATAAVKRIEQEAAPLRPVRLPAVLTSTLPSLSARRGDERSGRGGGYNLTLMPPISDLKDARQGGCPALIPASGQQLLLAAMMPVSVQSSVSNNNVVEAGLGAAFGAELAGQLNVTPFKITSGFADLPATDAERSIQRAACMRQRKLQWAPAHAAVLLQPVLHPRVQSAHDSMAATSKGRTNSSMDAGSQVR